MTKSVHFLLTIYNEVAPDGSPGLDYSDDIIIVRVKKGKRDTTVDLKDKNILIPDSGLFIAFEWMIIEENKYRFKYTLGENNAKIQGWLPGSKKKVYKDGLEYCPVIGTTPSDSSTSWHFLGGKWASSGIHKKSEFNKYPDKYDNKFGELAIKITLSN